MADGPFTPDDQLYGATRVASDGTTDKTTDPDSYREGRIFAVALSSTGSYVVTLSPGIGSRECAIRQRAVNGTPNANVQSNQTGPTTIEVKSYVGTVITSMGFELDVRKVTSGSI